MFPRFLVSLPLLVLTLLALSFQPGSAVPTPTVGAGHQSSLSSVVTVAQQSATTNEGNGLTQTTVPPPPPPAQTTPGENSTPVAAPTLLLQRAEPAADNKTEAEKKAEEVPAEKKPEPAAAPANPAGARTPKCVRKTTMGMVGDSLYQAPSLVRTYDITELEQEGVSDSDMEDKLTLATRHKCQLITDWHYFSSKGDGKGATLLFSTHLWAGKKCVQEAFIEAGFPKDFKC